jgi:hypothetical protein
MLALLSIILFFTTDIYEKVKIRRLKCIRTLRKTHLIYGECNKNASAVARLCKK